jgi:hypothetical protein
MSLDKKVVVFSACDRCDVICSRKNDWDRHILTAKHRKNMALDVSANSTLPKYTCDNCEYSCCDKYSWTKHIHTKKHKSNVLDEKLLKIPQIAQTEYTCEKCRKIYDKYNSYWAHTKKCSGSKPESSINMLINQLITDNKELRNFIIEQATEYKNFTIEQATEYKNLTIEHKKETMEIVNKVIENAKPVTNTINGNVNNQTNKFNINVFLNEHCKDAMNLSDFIKNIEVSREDLENNAQLGFVGGISKIFLDNLRQLSINERPIHCTDLKRETMYIKDDDKWTKETGPAKLNLVIQTITQKSTRTLLDWKKENPDYNDHDSEFSTRCIVIQRNSMAGHDRETYYPKVIRAIAKETMVDK